MAVRQWLLILGLPGLPALAAFHQTTTGPSPKLQLKQSECSRTVRRRLILVGGAFLATFTWAAKASEAGYTFLVRAAYGDIS